MDEKNELIEYLKEGMRYMVKGILKSPLRYRKICFFLAEYGKTVKKSHLKREELRKEGKSAFAFFILGEGDGFYEKEETDENIWGLEQWKDSLQRVKQKGGICVFINSRHVLPRLNILHLLGEEKKILFFINAPREEMTPGVFGMLGKYPNLIPVLSPKGDLGRDELAEKCERRNFIYGISLKKRAGEELIRLENKIKKEKARAIILIGEYSKEEIWELRKKFLNKILLVFPRDLEGFEGQWGQ